MANKIYCDFCGKEIDFSFGSIGKMAVVSKAVNLTIPTGQPGQLQNKVDEFDLCQECCEKALNALKKHDTNPTDKKHQADSS